MLKILIVSDDIYFMKGLESLIFEVNGGLIKKRINFVMSRKYVASNDANIIFRGCLASVRMKKKECLWPSEMSASNNMTLHIPFSCHDDNLQGIMGKIKKLLLIASMDHSGSAAREKYKSIGLKDFMQLSTTESKVMLLIGEGHNTELISKMLNRSEKTINTHYRNASRKLGMVNRIEFYRCASFIANSGSKNWSIICL
ncbi:helix-turn-helix transcriptional regulator [Pantoea sp. MBD-2R]|uniref:helix-turn-helix domain-containing protein n=1 Tax=Pantoea sp. MBD-2R TaxID=3141540 RepID=UPI00318445A2